MDHWDSDDLERAAADWESEKGRSLRRDVRPVAEEFDAEEWKRAEDGEEDRDFKSTEEGDREGAFCTAPTGWGFAGDAALLVAWHSMRSMRGDAADLNGLLQDRDCDPAAAHSDRELCDRLRQLPQLRVYRHLLACLLCSPLRHVTDRKDSKHVTDTRSLLPTVLKFPTSADWQTTVEDFNGRVAAGELGFRGFEPLRAADLQELVEYYKRDSQDSQDQQDQQDLVRRLKLLSDLLHPADQDEDRPSPSSDTAEGLSEKGRLQVTFELESDWQIDPQKKTLRVPATVTFSVKPMKPQEPEAKKRRVEGTAAGSTAKASAALRAECPECDRESRLKASPSNSRSGAAASARVAAARPNENWDEPEWDSD